MSHCSSSSCCSDRSLAVLLIRIVAATLLLISGTDKFKSATAPAVYSLDNYYGSADDIRDGKKPKWANIAGVIFQNSGLDNASQLPPPVANFNSQLFAGFGKTLPWMLIGSGALILLGIGGRWAWVAGCLTWASLIAGQTVIGEAPWMTYLLSYFAITLSGLWLNKYNRFTIGGLFTSSDSAESAE